jgi:hypothetical protein
MQTQEPALKRLSPLVGEWAVETSLAPPGSVRARTVFEWVLGGQFLLQRTEIDHPDAPDGLCIIAADPASDGFTQHYFDSRGVVRIYAMTFADGVWVLRRESPDFTPLAFAQRFVGELDDDGVTIKGRWETRPPDGSTWEHDFDLTYIRVGHRDP